MDQFRRHETNARDYLGVANNGMMDRKYLVNCSVT